MEITQKKYPHNRFYVMDDNWLEAFDTDSSGGKIFKLGTTFDGTQL